MASAWELGRPLYNRLPEEELQYQGNPAVDWLTQPWDAILMAVHEAIANVERDLIDPATARSEALDWLAQHHGFTGEYWDAEWSDPIKRTLIANAQRFIWGNKGRAELFQYLFEVFEIRARLYYMGSFLADINRAGDPVGGEGLTYFILMPLAATGYLRTSETWRLTEKLNRLYGPVYARSRVCYEQFYAGFSVAEDLVFSGVPSYSVDSLDLGDGNWLDLGDGITFLELGNE